eukprot:CAMPEP_0172551206 /NCGR_PEP_ID=MMETSP1067-20121228/36684_1 /TAXON_ID=265564 ORGANISM="Thalassiosira punctigera, Strain Tpunct2005C2" /NCGR_SAMPLE_ID=MMETSP1067 /ASSEMBLY_ACC=CAM_ASM_000444 /LENGTH=518 /DNA_ID=CAMNT_0013338961 /DNA_START=30 /DNA_END=1586 /DNA_ORIENTATION=-
MTDLQPWAVALIAAVASIAGAYLAWRVVLLLAPGLYRSMIKNNSVSVDDFVGGPPDAKGAFKSWLLNYFNVGKRAASKEGYPLKTKDSDKVPGLKVTSRNESGASLSAAAKPPVVVGTIRMGFGHHRIAYAATSWGLADDSGNDRETWFHDFLNIDSEEAQMIKDMDKAYSKGSRLASEMGGQVEKIWGSFTKAGDETSLRLTYQFSEQIIPLINGLDKNSPIIATHSMVACAAVAAGFKNVINLVIDNHAQWFVVVPNALNLVQGPSNYHSFLKMGVPEENLALAGHWIPRDLVEGIPDACARRVARRRAGKPLRIVVPVGGAGAQRKFIVGFVGALSGLVKEGKVQLFLNAADHAHMKDAFVGALESNGMEYDNVTDMAGVIAFKENMMMDEPSKNVTLFSYDDYFTAVATTDILCNVADVLACKPSELAFYPIPKLMIRRVGDHEAYSALRASELGDGTLELREVPVAVKYVKLMLSTNLLEVMCKSIENNNMIGLYDGCKNAMRLALERADRIE